MAYLWALRQYCSLALCGKKVPILISQRLPTLYAQVLMHTGIHTSRARTLGTKWVSANIFSVMHDLFDSLWQFSLLYSMRLKFVLTIFGTIQNLYVYVCMSARECFLVQIVYISSLTNFHKISRDIRIKPTVIRDCHGGHI